MRRTEQGKGLIYELRRAAGFLLAGLLVVCFVFHGSEALALTATAVDSAVICETASDKILGSYVSVTVEGYTPYVFVPTGAGGADTGDYATVSGMVAEYGEQEGILAAVNAGIYYNAGSETQYGFRYKEADGVVIANGVVLKSTESIDHTECDILVVDEDGQVGWTDYFADADALTAGTGYYYDIHGNVVTGKKIVSAVTGFVPILIDSEPVYDDSDPLLHGFDNYVGHYTQAAVRQILGVREDGAVVLISNSTGWTLEDAAQAALLEDCVFAYNLDGGGSAETVADVSGEMQTVRSQFRGVRTMPTYIVFTESDTPPVSAVPESITARVDGTLPAGATLGDIAGALTVTEHFLNADGNRSERIVYSAQTVASGVIRHTIVDASGEIRKSGVSPNGTLYYTKSEADTSLSLRNNDNTRQDGAYYDYSTGYSLSTADDLSTQGEKHILISYTPGAGWSTLTTEIAVLFT